MWTACKQDVAVTRFALLKNSYRSAEPLRCSLLRNLGNLGMNRGAYPGMNQETFMAIESKL